MIDLSEFLRVADLSIDFPKAEFFVRAVADFVVEQRVAAEFLQTLAARPKFCGAHKRAADRLPPVLGFDIPALYI